MLRDTGQCLTRDDAIEDKVSLHRKHIKGTGYHSTVVSGQMSVRRTLQASKVRTPRNIVLAPLNGRRVLVRRLR